MDQYTKNLERVSKYRFSYLQSFLSQTEKNKAVEAHNSRTSKTWFLPIISSLGAILALRNNQPNIYSKCCVATFLLLGFSMISEFRNNEILQRELNKLNRELPNPVQLQEEYTRDLEILRRISKN